MADMAYQDTGGHTGTWAIVEGVLLVIIGLVALFSPYATAAAAAVIFPVLLLFKGIVELVVSFRNPPGERAWHVVFGIVSLLAGIALLARPLLSGLTLVVVLLGYFLIDGIARIVVALASRATGWGWVLTSGILDLILFGYLLTQPLSVSAFVLGLLIGLNILFAGGAILAAGSMVRSQQHHASTGGMSPA